MNKRDKVLLLLLQQNSAYYRASRIVHRGFAYHIAFIQSMILPEVRLTAYCFRSFTLISHITTISTIELKPKV